MRILTTRRISQLFFFLLFIWLCVVATLGERWWQLRGWPINWFLQLDPLIGLSVLLSTHTVYAGLIWGVVTVALTFVLGRFFCGWVCPFGSVQQVMGYLGGRGMTFARRIQRNQPHPAQRVKYYILLFLLATASAGLLQWMLDTSQPGILRTILLVSVGALALTIIFKHLRNGRRAALVITLVIAAAGVILHLTQAQPLTASLQTGLLDPIALIYRSVTLVLLPLVDSPVKIVSETPRIYPSAGLIGLLFLLFLLLSLRIPRFYCRFICPLGALFGLLSRWSIWRIGQKTDGCTDCTRCEQACEGACAPAGKIRTSECVLCLNCLDECGHGVMTYHTQLSARGEQIIPDLDRRHVVAAMVGGLAAVPILRLDGHASANWRPDVIRPPGALREDAFLTRCIKCGQCMRVCPSNVIHPAGLQSGLEGLWTPLLHFRIGSSGCQHNCVACSQVCPTAALRPLSVDERMGRGRFASTGPLRIGMAFIDRGRCLPWAMDTPCIVCQENCPVSPKAIFTRTLFQPVRNSVRTVQTVAADSLVLEKGDLQPEQYGTGDYFCRIGDLRPVPIITNTHQKLILSVKDDLPALDRISGRTIDILIRLQQPYIDPHQCIGCGVCEHECPVQGRRAVRVSAENESRTRAHKLTLS
ncbi:MAG: 4Fe-4S ferredoxin [Desulfatitalea sp. BRH_c12]|nr:MAG: 4Fe-4S ferredoxin [Desulfatitalea sp. BRH_c12]